MHIKKVIFMLLISMESIFGVSQNQIQFGKIVVIPKTQGIV